MRNIIANVQLRHHLRENMIAIGILPSIIYLSTWFLFLSLLSHIQFEIWHAHFYLIVSLTNLYH